MGFPDEARTVNFSDISQFPNEARPMIVLGSFYDPTTGQRTVDAEEKERVREALGVVLHAFKGTGADMTFGPDGIGAMALYWNFDDEDGLVASQQLLT